MKKIKVLNELSAISTGFYKRSKTEGDTLYLQVKHFDQQGKFRQDVKFVSELLMEDNLRKHLLQNDDLLMLAKGDNNRVLLYDEEIGQAVASSSFILIRITSQQLLPKYLMWYLNTNATQKQLYNLAKGSSIRSLSKKALGNIPIPIPTMTIQKQILTIYDTWKQERQLTQQLLEDKESYYEHLLVKLSKETTTV